MDNPMFQNQIQAMIGEGGGYKATQDVTAFIDFAKEQREASSDNSTHMRKTGMRPAFIIPDIVAVDILHKFGINIYDQEELRNNYGKLKQIFRRHYPKLITGG